MGLNRVSLDDGITGILMFIAQSVDRKRGEGGLEPGL